MDSEILLRYITGNATEAEKEHIISWIDADDQHRKEYLALRKLHDISLWQEKPQAKQVSLRKRRSIVIEILKIAGIFLLAFLSYTQFYKSAPTAAEPILQTIYVPVGQRAELTLTDGTKVWLNANTTFTFPNLFTGSTREVGLDGEGYFAVSKDEKKPFIVKANNYNIKALGTEFNVLSYSQSTQFETALLEGSVEVSAPSAANPILLAPNTRLFLEDGILKRGKITHTNYFLWKDGIISFQNESVKDMITKLQLYYDVTIIVKDESLLKYRYSGKFRTKDGVEQVLKVLQIRSKFTYTKDDVLNQITIQ